MFKVGDRVKLIHTRDPYTKLESGARGTVKFIDSLGTIHVQWDNGPNLGMIPGEDVIVKV